MADLTWADLTAGKSLGIQGTVHNIREWYNQYHGRDAQPSEVQDWMNWAGEHAGGDIMTIHNQLAAHPTATGVAGGTYSTSKEAQAVIDKAATAGLGPVRQVYTPTFGENLLANTEGYSDYRRWQLYDTQGGAGEEGLEAQLIDEIGANPRGSSPWNFAGYGTGDDVLDFTMADFNEMTKQGMGWEQIEPISNFAKEHKIGIGGDAQDALSKMHTTYEADKSIKAAAVLAEENEVFLQGIEDDNQIFLDKQAEDERLFQLDLAEKNEVFLQGIEDDRKAGAADLKIETARLAEEDRLFRLRMADVQKVATQKAAARAESSRLASRRGGGSQTLSASGTATFKGKGLTSSENKRGKGRGTGQFKRPYGTSNLSIAATGKGNQQSTLNL
jgi:hypothetical protein